MAETVRSFHEATKHFPGRPSTSPYGLDWSIEPDLFKRYPGIEPEPPPTELAGPLRLGAGVHPRRGDPHYRTFMSAGALHPVELYVAAAAGLFHYNPGDGALRRLRAQDPRAALSAAAAHPGLLDAAYVLVLTGIVWRTAWKYGPRGWRHIFWDAGSMLANLLALLEGEDPHLITAFVDAEVAEVLGLERPHESPVALLGAGVGEPSAGPDALPPLEHESEPVSAPGHRFREAEEAQAASSLSGAGQVGAWRDRAQRFESQDGGARQPNRLEEVILRRGSARGFMHEPIGGEDLRAALAWACSPIPGDLPRVCSSFVIAHAVEGLEPAAYRFEPPDRFEQVRKGADRRRMAHLCLDQPHGGTAAATVFFTADLERTLGALGGRGYRAAQLEAGIRAGRASLGAYARGLGATGLTFYDDEVRRSLGTDEEPMMCVAVGVDARRPALRSGRPAA